MQVFCFGFLKEYLEIEHCNMPNDNNLNCINALKLTLKPLSMKTIFFSVFALMLLIFSSNVSGQECEFCPEAATIQANSPFPVWNPFVGEADIQANKYDFYARSFDYPESLRSLDFSGEPSTQNCSTVRSVVARRTLRYSYDDISVRNPNWDHYDYPDNDPTRYKYDSLDIYYSDGHDPNNSNGKPLVVLLHGGAGCSNGSAMVRSALIYAERGYVAIVPRYRSINRPDLWGIQGIVNNQGSFCTTETQLLYKIFVSVQDVRAAIRAVCRASKLAPLDPTLVFTAPENIMSSKIDCSKIFISGVSGGAITALHAVNMRSNEFPQGTVDFNILNAGGAFQFQASFAPGLDAIEICPGCTYSPWSLEDDDFASVIKGISCQTPFLTNLNYIEQSDTIPTLLFHGIHDALAPFHFIQYKDFLYNRELVSQLISSFNPPTVTPPITLQSLVQNCNYNTNYFTLPTNVVQPCSTTLPDYWLFGSQPLYNKWRALNNNSTFPGFYTGFIRICNENHALDQFRSIGSTASNIKLGSIQYETVRFFSTILNYDPNVPASNKKTSFRFNLDNSLNGFLGNASLADFEDALLWKYGNHPIPLLFSYLKGPSITLSQLNSYCPSCTDVTAYTTRVRSPYFNSQNTDGNRYGLITQNERQNICQACVVPNMLSIESDILTEPSTYNWVVRNSVGEIRANFRHNVGVLEEKNFPQEFSNLIGGLYFVHIIEMNRKFAILLK